MTHSIGTRLGAFILVHLLLSFLSACAPACGDPGRHELLLALPPAPAAWSWLPDLIMEVTWKSAGGGLRTAFAKPGSTLRAEVERGLPQAILALPSSRGRELRPAGALYPEGLAEGRAGDDAGNSLVLDWTGGYAASVALALARAGIDPWCYDLSRLAREALVRCSDPWLIPATEAARRLSALEFRLDAYGEPARGALTLPGAGPWAPESPFENAPASSTVLLSEGLWRFLDSDGELFLAVDAEGRAGFVRR
jgi:hypothetical protein